MSDGAPLGVSEGAAFGVTAGAGARAWPRRVGGVLLTLLLPGLGQVLAGSWRLGCGIILAGLVFVAGWRVVSIMAPPVPWVLALSLAMAVVGGLALYGGSAVDAWRRLGDPLSVRRWYRSTWLAALVGLGGHFAITTVLPPGWVRLNVATPSMKPVLLEGDTVAVVPGDAGLTRGGLIAFSGSRFRVPYIKRVIGMPGDRVAIVAGRVVLNGTQLARRGLGNAVVEALPGGPDYVVAAGATGGPDNNIAEVTVPADRFYVLGDNRDHSLDSRAPEMGLIARDDVIGVPRTIFWSLRPERWFMPVR